MTASTGWNNGLCQDYDRKLGNWFINRLGSWYQLRKNIMEQQPKTLTEAERLANELDGTIKTPYWEAAAELRRLQYALDEQAEQLDIQAGSIEAVQAVNMRQSAEIERLKMVSDTDKAIADHWRGECERLKRWHAEMADERNALASKCDTLRAELAAIRAQEPVAVVESDAPGGIAYTPAGLELVDGQELYAYPKPAEPLTDADGDAFRKAAELGLTLRFYGGCAQSSMPGSPSAYEVVTGADRASAMRHAIDQAAAVIAKGGEAQHISHRIGGQP